jgi:hypothetical protein
MGNDMRIGSVSKTLLMLIAGGTASLVPAGRPACAAPCAQTDLVEFEKSARPLALPSIRTR